MPHCVFPRSGGGKAEYHAAVLNDKIGLPDRSADRFCVFWQNAVKYRAEWQVIVTLRWDDLRIVQRLFLAEGSWGWIDKNIPSENRRDKTFGHL